ncbi:MAG: sigma-70 family RNA polymerase sigma factor, partial [Pseudomonadota bacterium]
MRVISNPAFDEDTAEAVDADAHLLKRIEQGDLTAMKTLYEAHSAAIHRFVRSRIRDEFEASDIVHETMLSVWRGAAGFQNRSTVLSWMLTLARNKTVDHLRKQSRVTLAEPDETIAGDDPDVET